MSILNVPIDNPYFMLHSYISLSTVVRNQIVLLFCHANISHMLCKRVFILLYYNTAMRGLIDEYAGFK